MNKKSSESSVVRSEGKSYGLQRPQEAVTDASLCAPPDQKLLDALSVVQKALLGNTRDCGPDGAGVIGGPQTGGTTGVGTTGGVGSSGGVGAPNGRPGVGGGSSASGGERPSGEAGQLSVSESSNTIKAQREAFQRDRGRESTRRPRSQTERVNAVGADGATTNPHLSDSNRAPITESREFAPMFGASGRPKDGTIESMTVASARPETVPSIGTASTRPIDAYFGSFGTSVERAEARAQLQYQVLLESIIGADDRERVTATSRYPWCCVCSLLITAKTGVQYIGTGWLVSPRLVLTAGHCVFMAAEEGWASQIEVIPGRNGADRPFGSAVSRELRSVAGWTRDRNSDFDYGAIILPSDKRYGEQLGWFGFASKDDEYLKSVELNLAGYPGDGGKAGQQVDGSQWFNHRGVKEVMEHQISYEIDTYGGQSGAPVWEMRADGGRYGVGIHTWGTSVANGATRITRDVFDNILLWAGQAP